MRVISYTRFSSIKQSKGLSLRRQIEAADEWCRKHKLTLDESLHDAGKSGWSGENSETGALSVLLQMARDGKIEPGTILLIEALDRLTRQDLTVAVPLLIELLSAGIEVVTTQDNAHYTKESLQKLPDFMFAIMLLSRGNEESERKSTMVRKAFQANRDDGRKQIFGSAPGWLQRENKYAPWELVPEKAEVVRKVFELSAAGWGSSEIARKANTEQWPVPTRLANKKRGGGWATGMAARIIRNRAAIGEHEHRDHTHEAHKKKWDGVSRGVAITDYYPPVVSEQLFYEAQAAIDRRRKPVRRDACYFNIWSGLLKCGACGSGIQRKTDISKTDAYRWSFRTRS